MSEFDSTTDDEDFIEETEVDTPQIPNPMCPHYVEFDKRARNEIKERITDHLTKREKVVKQIFNYCIDELKKLNVPLPSPIPPISDEPILKYALEQMEIKIDDWNGVQIDQCKDAINTWEKFKEKAKNHQDQTSWKVSGNDFFAHYIRQARPFISLCCSEIENMEYREVMIDLICLFFASKLMNETIKFHRTKPKPLIRHRTWTRSIGIHNAMVQLYRELKLPEMIKNEKIERKKMKNKNNIIAKDFHAKLLSLCDALYKKQQRKLNQLISPNYGENDGNNGSGGDDDDDDVNTEMKIDEYVDDSAQSVSYSTSSTATIQSWQSWGSSQSPQSPHSTRKFQSTNEFEGNCIGQVRSENRRNKRKRRSEYLTEKRSNRNNGLIFDHSNGSSNGDRVTLLPPDLSEQMNCLQMQNQKMRKELDAIHNLLICSHNKYSQMPHFDLQFPLPQMPVQTEYAMEESVMPVIANNNQSFGIAATLMDRELSIPPAVSGEFCDFGSVGGSGFGSCNNSIINSPFYGVPCDVLSTVSLNDNIHRFDGESQWM